MATTFDPVLLLYLNPELTVDSNVITVEDAIAFNATGDGFGLWSNLDMVPSLFDEAVFVADNKADINVSGINRYIKNAMLLDGGDIEDLERDGRYGATIYRNAYVQSTKNEFRFNLAGDLVPFAISECNLQVGDWLKLIKNNSETHYGWVTSVSGNDTFTLSNPRYAFLDAGGEYLVYGIKVYDMLRLAHINYLRQFATTPAPPTTSYVNLDPEFNFELYKLLYPDARLLDRDAAFVDWANRMDNEDVRIGRTRDINTDSNSLSTAPTNFDYLKVNQHLHLSFTQSTGRLQWGDLNLFYVTTNDWRAAAQIPPIQEGLITERAIKTYIDRSFLETAVFNDVVVNGLSTFTSGASFLGSNTYIKTAEVGNLIVNSNVTISNALDVYGHTVFWGALSFKSNVTFNTPVLFTDPVVFAGECNIFDTDVVTNAAVFANGPVTLCNVGSFMDTCEFFGNVYTYSNVHGVGALYQTGVATFCNEVLFDARVVMQNGALDVYDVATFSNAVNVDGLMRVTKPAEFFDQVDMHYPLICHNFFEAMQLAVFNETRTQQAWTLDAYTSNLHVLNCVACNCFVQDLLGSNLDFFQISTPNLYAAVIVNETYSSLKVRTSNLLAIDISCESLVASNLYAEAGWVEHFEASNARVFLFESRDDAEFGSNVLVHGALTVSNDVEVHGTMYGGNICIADILTVQPPDFSVTSNIVMDNIHVNDTLTVQNNMIIGTQYTTEQMVCKVNGIIEAANYDVTSDARLKENIRDVDCDAVLGMVKSIKPCTFNYKNKGNGKSRYGFVAQDIECVFPELVSRMPIYAVDIERHASALSLGSDKAKLHTVFYMPAHGFEIGDRLVVAHGTNEQLKAEVDVVGVVDADVFETNARLSGHVVFVKSVVYKDVRTIDYQQLASVMFSAMHSLARRVEELETLHADSEAMSFVSA